MNTHLKQVMLPLCAMILPYALGTAYAWDGRDLDDISDAELIERGEALYFAPGSCSVCHGDTGQGGIGPAFGDGPTPREIMYQFQSNPQMASIYEILKPTDNDLFAMTYFIQQMSGNSVAMFNRFDLRNELSMLNQPQPEMPELVFTGRDAVVEQIADFQTVLDDWTRKANTGPLVKHYDVDVLGEYDPGEPVFEPEPGGLYFYENLDKPNFFYMPFADRSQPTANASQVVVGDAITHEIIAAAEMPEFLSGQVHTTVMTGDGKYVYITGPSAEGAPEGNMEIIATASLVKVDALTLQPVKQLNIGGRLHHGQLFRDELILMDTFSRDPDALDIFLLDPATDEIVGGIQCEDLGGSCYTSFTDGNHIYVLMQPAGYGPPAFSGIIGGESFVSGKRTVLRPYWVARLDPNTWEVLQEYPYPGYRGNWVDIDKNSEFMYVPAGGTSNVSKINIDTGEIVWVSGAGTGPYGGSLNLDETEFWTADKGEVTGFRGRTVTVIDTETGHPVHTLLSGYTVDHLLLAPNGKEMWGTANGENGIWVFNTETKENTDIIEMPGLGNPHGLVWVSYDDDGVGKVVRDQGGFHNGVDPYQGLALDYPAYEPKKPGFFARLFGAQ